MTVEENKANVRRIWDEVWNLGKLDVVDEVLAKDYVGHIPSMPEGVHGTEGFKQLITVYRTAFPDVHLTVEDLIAEGDRVVARWVTRGTHTGDMMGIPPTGSQIEIMGISIFHVIDGKVKEEWEGFDSLNLMQQLGVIPTPEQSEG